jgi:hypothetical protein
MTMLSKCQETAGLYAVLKDEAGIVQATCDRLVSDYMHVYASMYICVCTCANICKIAYIITTLGGSALYGDRKMRYC